MIRDCTADDFEAVYAIINKSAQAYRDVIPADRWHEPYMPRDELASEIAAGVGFLGCVEDDALVGVMGTQPVGDVTLIRHAYVLTRRRRGGIGGALLAAARARAGTPVLVGTWAAATWAIGFYEKHGFRLLRDADKSRLLKSYWTVPERQIESSVVLADPAWLAREGARPA